MSELQKIAVGLLSMSHPEIYRFRNVSAEPPAPVSSALQSTQGADPKPTPAARVLRGLRFALAALLAGARSIPLGDNGRVTRELGEYGSHLRGC